MFKGLLDEVNTMNPSEEDIKNCEKFLCRLYKDPSSESLDSLRVRTLLISTKPEENPPTSNAGRFHILRSIFQASRWEYAYLPYHCGLPSATDYGGYYIDDSGKMLPIIMTLEPMPDVVEEIITCNCLTKCVNKRCSCKLSGNKCALLCHKKLKYSHDNCENMNH